MIKTCAKCGKEFDAWGRAYSCPGCKKRKQLKLSLAGKELTIRERQVIALVHAAKGNKEIATELYLSEGTIKEYLVTIFKKLRVKNRVAIALWAERNWSVVKGIPEAPVTGFQAQSHEGGLTQ